MLSFGTVFRNKEGLYVYLVTVSESVYAAKILDPEITKQLLNMRDGKPKGKSGLTDNAPMFSFVILTTDDFCDQAAHYAEHHVPTDMCTDVIGQINEHDRNLLIEEIRDDSASPTGLRNAVSEMFPKKE